MADEKQPPVPSKKQLRDLINERFNSDPDLDAFLIDHFPQVKQRFASAADRVARVNLLFELCANELHKIWEALQLYDSNASLTTKPLNGAANPPVALVAPSPTVSVVPQQLAASDVISPAVAKPGVPGRVVQQSRFIAAALGVVALSFSSIGGHHVWQRFKPVVILDNQIDHHKRVIEDLVKTISTPENPNSTLLIEQEQICNQNPKDNWRACGIAGNQYWLGGNLKSACTIYNKACSVNNESCILLYGTPKNDNIYKECRRILGGQLNISRQNLLERSASSGFVAARYYSIKADWIGNVEKHKTAQTDWQAIMNGLENICNEAKQNWLLPLCYSEAQKKVACNTKEEIRLGYLFKFCDQTEAIACFNLAELYQDFRQADNCHDKHALYYYHKACTLGFIRACACEEEHLHFGK